MFANDAPDIVQKYLIESVFDKYDVPRSSAAEKEETKKDAAALNKRQQKQSEKEGRQDLKIIS